MDGAPILLAVAAIAKVRTSTVAVSGGGHTRKGIP